MEPKAPRQEGKITEARVILTGEALELKKVFDFATTLSNDPYPRSSTPDGTGKIRSILKDGRELMYSLQDTSFQKIFTVFSETEFFKTRMEEFLGEVTYTEFLDFVDKAFKQEKGKLGREVVKKCEEAIYNFCNKYRQEIIFKFDFADDVPKEKRGIDSSDLLINTLVSIHNLGRRL